MTDSTSATAATEREEAIARIMRRTGKTREQAVAFLDILGSASRRRGWAEGEPLGEPQIAERLDTFLGGAPCHLILLLTATKIA